MTKQPKIVIYSTATCPYCKLAKEFFKSHDVAYQEIDVTTDADKQNEMFKKSGQLGVPVIIIDHEVIVGFDEEKLKKILKI